jgi:hypothetical protein
MQRADLEDSRLKRIILDRKKRFPLTQGVLHVSETSSDQGLEEEITRLTALTADFLSTLSVKERRNYTAVYAFTVPNP